LRMQKKLISIY